MRQGPLGSLQFFSKRHRKIALLSLFIEVMVVADIAKFSLGAIQRCGSGLVVQMSECYTIAACLAVSVFQRISFAQMHVESCKFRTY